MQTCFPLHARVLGLISHLPHKNYTLGMDNLYMSAKLCRLALSMPQKVMCHGVTRPSLSGVPQNVKQTEVARKKELETVRNTVKVAVLQGDMVCKDLVCVSLYDTKPVYILSNCCDGIRWIKKERKVFSKEKGKEVIITFYRLNVIEYYNYNMGSVDLADQLWNHY